ncbi:hypothetical protein [Tabrizicola oligotrophica]|nr:hypothetical protein [Tabrizicola oligotrophica]
MVSSPPTLAGTGVPLSRFTGSLRSRGEQMRNMMRLGVPRAA